jgi:hypothetical protein
LAFGFGRRDLSAMADILDYLGSVNELVCRATRHPPPLPAVFLKGTVAGAVELGFTTPAAAR